MDDAQKRIAFYEATKQNNAKRVRSLVDEGAKMDYGHSPSSLYKQDDDTALHVAAKNIIKKKFSFSCWKVFPV